MNEELITIIRDYEKSGQIFADGKRNKIKTFQYRGITINIKSFKIPILINGLFINISENPRQSALSKMPKYY